jgi:formate hydrogenlyase subunit 6/NADH:ubiquinone oxidoreductase subunit I
MARFLALPMVWRSLKNLFSRPATRLYPAEARPRPEGARGKLELELETCVFCGVCVRKCPCGAIVVSREEKRFDLEPLRCISCGACVDACTKHSLALGSEALPVQERSGLVERHQQVAPPPKDD